jgi:hypothetical protein
MNSDLNNINSSPVDLEKVGKKVARDGDVIKVGGTVEKKGGSNEYGGWETKGGRGGGMRK